MSHIAATAPYLFIRAAFATMFLLWGALWALVAFYYGRASYVSWRINGGLWRRAIQDILDPFCWAIKEQLCRFKMFRGSNFCGTEIPSPYENGNLLRFAIFMSSLTPIGFGLFFFDTNRTDWTYTKMLISLFFASSSILAAGGHMFLAYRHRPHSWRRLVVTSFLWVMLGYPGFCLYFQNHPLPLSVS